MTENARVFMAANDESAVVGSEPHVGGVGTYTLADGRVFRMTLQDMRACPVGRYPKWFMPPAKRGPKTRPRGSACVNPRVTATCRKCGATNDKPNALAWAHLHARYHGHTVEFAQSVTRRPVE